MLNQIPKTQLDYIKLWYLVQHSLSAFAKLEKYFGSIESAIGEKQLLKWTELNLHQNHIQRAKDFLTDLGQQKFEKCLNDIKQYSDFILTHKDAGYPKQLLPFSDHPPVLFGKGSIQNLSQPQIAIVGSRKPSPHGKQVAYDFAYYLSEKGFFITSGLAEGIDEAAHLGANKNQKTIAVVGTGLDMIYPHKNQRLQSEILQHHGSIVSEFLPTTPPAQQNFPRRNRIVSGLSLGVLVAEAATHSGSLITAKLAADQGKTVFAIPGHIYAEYHKGCHQLIREGAVLIDHPEQIIEDLALPAQWHSQQQSESIILQSLEEIPENLFKLYQELDWIGLTIDQLATKLKLTTAELTSDLMQLELLGLCIQQSGLYLRCRKLH
nr:DNA-processing protein DprA [Acinetobacter sp. Marseille-Q1620]